MYNKREREMGGSEEGLHFNDAVVGANVKDFASELMG